MSLSKNESELLAMRDGKLTSDETTVIDETFDNLGVLFGRLGRPLPGDDRAARFEAALIRFLIVSRAA